MWILRYVLSDKDKDVKVKAESYPTEEIYAMLARNAEMGVDFLNHMRMHVLTGGEDPREMDLCFFGRGLCAGHGTMRDGAII